MVRKSAGLPGSGRIGRRVVTLMVALTFSVLTVSGVMAFVLPFWLPIIGLHALMGFVFVLLIGFHVSNNIRPMKTYLQSRVVWVCLAITAGLTALFYLQPSPIKAILSLSGNLGPALDRFEISDEEMVYDYVPADHYRMSLRIKTGESYQPASPPHLAIWLENQGGYHIKTLLSPESGHQDELPYWSFKVKGWEAAKLEAAKKEAAIREGAHQETAPHKNGDREPSLSNTSDADDFEIDGISAATPNGSFDPKDYILPTDRENPMPYKLLFEINQPADAYGGYEDQPSLVYSVEIDNAWPKTFQLLDLVGYPKREDGDSKETWSLYYVDDQFGSALELIDSALLTIRRSELKTLAD
jgi:hypothetical protein